MDEESTVHSAQSESGLRAVPDIGRMWPALADRAIAFKKLA